TSQGGERRHIDLPRDTESDTLLCEQLHTPSKMAAADISSFVDITGTSAPVARGFLEMTNGDMQQAIQLFFENPDLQYSIRSGTRPEARSSRQQRGVREDDQGVIHIDSDDDDNDSGD